MPRRNSDRSTSSQCLTCTFRESCCSARLSWAQDKRGGVRGGGTACTGGYNGVRAVRPESVAGGGWFEVLWNLECPVGLSQRKEGTKCLFNDALNTFYLLLYGVREISMKDIWRNLDGPPKNKELESQPMLAPLYRACHYTGRAIIQGVFNRNAARCRLGARAFARGAMGHGFDHSWWTHWAISRSSYCSTTGVTKVVVCAILFVVRCI